MMTKSPKTLETERPYYMLFGVFPGSASLGHVNESTSWSSLLTLGVFILFLIR